MTRCLLWSWRIKNNKALGNHLFVQPKAVCWRIFHQDEDWGLTHFCATALVLDDVLMIKALEDVNLLHPALHIPTPLFQFLHSDMFSGAIVLRVIQAQIHLSKVALETEQGGVHHFKFYIKKKTTTTQVLLQLTSPNLRIIFRYRLWNRLGSVVVRVTLGDMSGSVNTKHIIRRKKSHKVSWLMNKKHWKSKDALLGMISVSSLSTVRNEGLSPGS